jgi:hypothetical protein
MEIMDLLTCQIEEAKTSKDMQQMHSKVKGHYENHLNNPYYSTRAHLFYCPMEAMLG